MPRRRCPFENGLIYHVFNKSIYRFVIFNNQYEYEQMFNLMRYYQYAHEGERGKFSSYQAYLKRHDLTWDEEYFSEKDRLVEIIAYCFMPTHVHFALKQLEEEGINRFMHRLLSSYSHYFNCRYDRHGPLWQNRFKNVLVEGDLHLEQLIEYIHDNPVKAKLVKEPADWHYSSAGLAVPGTSLGRGR